MNNEKIPHIYKNLNVSLFCVTITSLIAILSYAFFDFTAFSETINFLRSAIISNISWFIVISLNVFLCFLLYLAFSKYGEKKLGKDDEKPELSTFSWVALLFGAGVGSGFCFWPIVEPLWHYYTTPYLYESQTKEALSLAKAITFYNWGFHMWTPWALVALAIAVPAFRQSKPMTISGSLLGILKEKTDTSIYGKIASIIGMIGTIFAISMALATGILLISAGIYDVFGIEVTPLHQIYIMIIFTIIYVTAACSGLEKGMTFLGDSNIYILAIWFSFLLISGPTATMLNGIIDTLGAYTSSFFKMALFTDSTKQTDNWPGTWSIFYYLWNIAWAPYVGGFIARISRGRTIRQFILGVLILPVTVTLVWVGIMGTGAQYVDQNQLLDIMARVNKDPALVVYALIEAFGGGIFMKSLILLNIITFVLTAANCASYFIAMQMTNGSLNPPKFHLIIWGIIIGLLAIIVINLGGVSGIQAIAVIAGAPFLFIVWIMAFSLFLYLKNEEQFFNIHSK